MHEGARTTKTKSVTLWELIMGTRAHHTASSDSIDVERLVEESRASGRGKPKWRW